MTRKNKPGSLVLNESSIIDVYPSTENQRIAFQSWNEGDDLVLAGSAGTGKAQPLHSKILTPSGWKAMSDIKIGDFVVTPGGDPAPVIGVFPQGNKPNFRVTFADGAQTECCGEHLWTGWVISRKGKKATYETLSLNQVATLRRNGGSFSIPLITPTIGSAVNLAMDPYLLGVLLGDGSLGGSSVMFSSADPELVDAVESIVTRDYPELSVKYRSNYDYAITRKRRGGGQHSLQQALRALAVNVKSYLKHIPPSFLEGSLEQRLSLLQGLMDTDGTVCGRRGTVSFTTVSNSLARDVQYLIRSVGGKSSITTIATDSTHGVRYDVSCSLRDKRTLFRLDRKRRLVKPTQEKQFRRKMVSIEPLPPMEMRCIMIDHPDHLYITDDFIVTHNTFLALNFGLRAVLKDDTYGDKKQHKVVIFRSAVATRPIGFLPGNLKEKIEEFAGPYKGLCSELLNDPDAFTKLSASGVLQFETTSYIRGLTINDAVIIVDEMQNLNFHELDSVITRVGKNCRIIFCGDYNQSDFKEGTEREGLLEFLNIIEHMNNFSIVSFTWEDIVRSGLVRDYIMTKEMIFSRR